LSPRGGKRAGDESHAGEDDDVNVKGIILFS
jgi:hypothetical protein